ncbi:MAG TPA: formyltransferase family protein [Candidatus Paceibacterota bacterium]
MSKPKLLVFASGSAEGGGSGFENLVLRTMDGVLDAVIVAVVSNHKDGGVRKRADMLKVPFIYFPKPWGKEQYQQIVESSGADFSALSGWLKNIVGLDPRSTFNIHPGPLPKFGGAGMYGHHVHEAVVHEFKRGTVTHSAVCMHFVTAEYDRGPVFFTCRVPIHTDDTPESLGQRINRCEHYFQPEITDLIVHEEIRWDGKNPYSLVYPRGYNQTRYYNDSENHPR